MEDSHRDTVADLLMLRLREILYLVKLSSTALYGIELRGQHKKAPALKPAPSRGLGTFPKKQCGGLRITIGIPENQAFDTMHSQPPCP